MALQVMRKVAVISVLALVMGLAGGVSAQPMEFAQTAPMTWTVLVGGQGEMQKQEMGMMGAWQFMRFYPDTITVNVGDTVMWKLNSAELHSVNVPKAGDKVPDLIVMEGTSTPPRVLLNPLAVLPQGGSTYDGTALAGAGQMGGGAQFPTEWKLTFTQAGTFDYFCAFHPMMMGKVIVQAAGAAYPKTQAQIDADAKAQLDADVAAATKVEATIKPPAADPRSDGTSLFKVDIGYGDGILTWMRFSPANLTVHVGDTVQWTQKDPMAPHTITFISSDSKEPELVLPEPQKAGPPKLVLNPEMIFPVGGATYSGTGYVNSGFLWGFKDPTPGPREYSLTFDTPGTFKYICVLHDDMGMAGQITVLPKGAKS